MERLSKNFIWMAAANGVTTILNIIIFIYLARVLMPEALGYLSYAQALVFFMLNFADLGLTTYGVRQVARDKTKISQYVSDIVSFKFFVAIPIFLAVIMALPFLPQPGVTKILIAESCIFFFTIACAVEWAFQAVERMQMVLVSFAVTCLLQLGLILAFVKGPEDVLKVPIIQAAAMLPVTIAFLKILKFRPTLRKLNIGRLWSHLSSSLVIWSIAIFVQVYNGLDIILLGFFRGPEEIGYFAIARRVVGGAGFLIIFLINAALPRLSCTFADDIAQFKADVKKFLKVVTAFSLFICLPVAVFNRQIISAAFGSEYLPVSFSFVIMMAGLVLVLFNLPYSTALIAACHEKAVLIQVIASAAVSVIANLVLMPKYGMIGAAVAFLLAEAVALAWILVAYDRKIGYN